MTRTLADLDEVAAAAVARLADEFPTLRRPVLVTVVRTSRADLSGVPEGAVPELVERLARQRLLDRERGIDPAGRRAH